MAAGMLSATIAATPVNAADLQDNSHSNIPYGAIATEVLKYGVRENIKENAFTYGTTFGVSYGFVQKRQEMLKQKV